MAERSFTIETPPDVAARWPDVASLYATAAHRAPEPHVWDVMRLLADVRAQSLALPHAV